MFLESDISLSSSRFKKSSVDASTNQILQTLGKATENAPKWYEEGVVEYRRMIYEGKTQFPVPPLLPSAKDAEIPSREPGRHIPLRLYEPDSGQPSNGIYLYFHGGGFVLGSHKDQDEMLKTVANSHGLTAISVGYRLAPENPFPAGLNDCIDVAEYLVDNGPSKFDAPLRAIGGASSGGNFAAITTFELMRTRPHHRLDAVLLVNGLFDMTLNLPTSVQFNKAVPVDREMMEEYLHAYAPGTRIENRRDPRMSPLYEDVQKLASESPLGTLPPVLITCGTADPLLDDSLLMSCKWIATGSEAVVKLFPGAPHMFSAFKGSKEADNAADATKAFLSQKLANAG